MGRRKKPLLENILITDIGAEGKAIAKVESKVLFIPFGIPGDIVDVQVTNTRKKFYEGYIVRYQKHSEIKVVPFCKHFTVCGGCKWQHLPYEKQLYYKEKQVIDNFQRIGKITDFKANPIIPSDETKFYRNKLEYTFTDNRWLTQSELESGIKFDSRAGLGFHIPGKFDKILDIEECYLQPHPSNEIRLAVKNFACENNYTFFNPINQEGFFRNLIIRTSNTNEVMIILSFFYEDIEKREKLLEFLKNKFPEISSLQYVINQKLNETLFDQEIKVYHGKDHIIEELDGLKIKIGPKSFYQTNSGQTAKLYNVALKMAGPNPDVLVYDLYTGTGTIAQFFARHYKKVIGIEIIPEAINDAKENASINKIKNIDFYAGDVKDILNENFIKEHGKPELIILDPPRSGLHPSVIELLSSIRPREIIYISCNPATQARDLSFLNDQYKISEIQPVDMFPHTHHVENIAKLSLRDF